MARQIEDMTACCGCANQCSNGCNKWWMCIFHNTTCSSQLLFPIEHLHFSTLIVFRSPPSLSTFFIIHFRMAHGYFIDAANNWYFAMPFSFKVLVLSPSCTRLPPINSPFIQISEKQPCTVQSVKASSFVIAFNLLLSTSLT